MYKIKDEILKRIEKSEKSGYKFCDTAWSNTIEKVELPKVELKFQHTKNFSIQLLDNDCWIIFLNYFGLTIASVEIGKHSLIKTISDFNEKSALLFGFKLIESEVNK